MNTDCVIFSGCIDARGYGKMRYNGRVERAHRVAYMRNVGKIPAGKVVRHKCDNPSCVNPQHLELGSQLDNVRDIYERNRQADHSGENNSQAQLTVQQVREIKYALLSPYRGIVRDLAAKYGVSRTIVTNIKIGRTWTFLNN